MLSLVAEIFNPDFTSNFNMKCERDFFIIAGEGYETFSEQYLHFLGGYETFSEHSLYPLR